MTTSKLTRIPTDRGYSLAIVVPPGTRSLVFLSGQIGVDETGKIVPGGFEAEVRQCFANLQATLERAGGTLEDVVRITFFFLRISPITLSMQRLAPSSFRLSSPQAPESAYLFLPLEQGWSWRPLLLSGHRCLQPVKTL
jgi:enamine deaminase RidA (YjgF/YER057c/UK114 family)